MKQQAKVQAMQAVAALAFVMALFIAGLAFEKTVESKTKYNCHEQRKCR